jgi:hypothetical protein
MSRYVSELGKNVHAFKSSIFARVQQYFPTPGDQADCSHEERGPSMSSSERAYGVKRKKFDRWSVEVQQRSP